MFLCIASVAALLCIIVAGQKKPRARTSSLTKGLCMQSSTLWGLMVCLQACFESSSLQMVCQTRLCSEKCQANRLQMTNAMHTAQAGVCQGFSTAVGQPPGAIWKGALSLPRAPDASTQLPAQNARFLYIARRRRAASTAHIYGGAVHRKPGGLQTSGVLLLWSNIFAVRPALQNQA